MSNLLTQLPALLGVLVGTLGMLTRVNDARDGYYRAARRSLGVRGGSVEQSATLRQALVDRSTATPEVPAN